jgi:hypothetical protein
MKVSKTRGCLLLLGALFNFSGCDRIMKVLGIGGDGAHVTATRMPVSIKGCSAADPIVVHTWDPVTWSFSDKSYVITFDPKYDPNSSPPKIITPSPASLTHPTPQTLNWDTNGTPTDCSINITTNKKEGCYFKYSISVVGGQVCNDPGIHIIP